MNAEASHTVLADVLSKAPFTQLYHFSIHRLSEGQCTLKVPYRKDLERPGGVIAGHVFMAAADAAMWLAIKTQCGVTDGSVTSEMTTHFLRRCRASDILCAARIVKIGQRRIFGVAECCTISGELLAYHTLSYSRLLPAVT